MPEDDTAGEWRRRHADQIELRRALAGATSDDERQSIVARIKANKEAIAHLEEAVGEPVVAPTSPAPGPAPDRPSAGPSPETAPPDDDVDELLELLVYRHERAAGAEPEPGPPPRRPAAPRPEHRSRPAPAPARAPQRASRRPPTDPPAIRSTGGGESPSRPRQPPSPAPRRSDPSPSRIPTTATTAAMVALRPAAGPPEREAEEVPDRRPPLVAVAAAVALIGLGAVGLIVGLTGDDDDRGLEQPGPTATVDPRPPSGDEPDRATVVAALARLDQPGVTATLNGSTVVVAGSVAAERERDEVLASVAAAAPDFTIDANALTVAVPLRRIALVAPSAADDRAFTQSMVDAVAALERERGNVELAVQANVTAREAGTAIAGFADAGFDLIIVHSSAFRGAVLPIAADHPDIAFALGTSTETTDLPNVYVYDVAAEQGGYILGALAASMSETDVIGAIGPVEVGTSKRYIDGFRAGAEAERPGITVLVSYTGSFSNGDVAAAEARRQIDAGADALTGHGHVMGPAIAAAADNDVRWLGSQVDQAPVAPSVVVASQVYHWEVVLATIVAAIDDGTADGRRWPLIADLGNGGITIETNDPAGDTRDRVDELTSSIVDGTVDLTGRT